MGRKLGSVPGWERVPEWSSDNRIYIGPGHEDYGETDKKRNYIYEVEFNIELYFGDTDCEHPNDTVLIRKIENPPISVVRVRNIKYPGDLDAFVNYMVEKESEKLIGESITELGGLATCSPSYKVDIINKDFRLFYDYIELPVEIPVEPPVKVKISERIQGIIAHIQQELYESETYDEKLALRNEAVALLIRSGIDKEDAMKLIKIK